jgi:hypothetical protein
VFLFLGNLLFSVVFLLSLLSCSAVFCMSLHVVPFDAVCSGKQLEINRGLEWFRQIQPFVMQEISHDHKETHAFISGCFYA